MLNQISNIMKTIIITSLILIGLTASAGAYFNHLNKKTEKVKYTVLKKYNEFEIRSYPDLIIASTVCGTGKYESNSGKGFRKIAGYIFGGNEESQQIAMTSPVKMTLGDTMKMSFYMPLEYTKSELPEPKDKSVQIGVDKKQIIAAIQFGGWANQEKIDAHKKKLIKLLNWQGIKHNNDFAFLGYNAPFEMINRRNEVIVSLKDYQ